MREQPGPGHNEVPTVPGHKEGAQLLPRGCFSLWHLPLCWTNRAPGPCLPPVHNHSPRSHTPALKFLLPIQTPNKHLSSGLPVSKVPGMGLQHHLKQFQQQSQSRERFPKLLAGPRWQWHLAVGLETPKAAFMGQRLGGC